MITAWIILAIAFLLIIGFPAIQQAIPFLAKNTKSYHVFGLFSTPAQPDTATVPDLPFPIDTMEMDTMTVDSTQIMPTDSMAHASKSTSVGLTAFNRAMHDLKKKKKKRIRILWFGDSMVEGDLITQDVRDSLQRHLGGSGVGYAPVTSVVAGFRASVRASFSNNWKYQSLVMRKSKPVFPLSVTGEYFTAQRDTSEMPQGHRLLSATFKPGGNYAGTSALPNPVLLYGPRKQDSTCVDTANFVLFKGDTIPLDGTRILNTIRLEEGNPKLVELEFLLKPDQPVYGISFESVEGVILDNFALRGNSGMAAATIRKDMYRAYAEEMGADLIVIHYGVNASALGMTQYSWYRHAMVRAIGYMKDAFPEASFLVLSIADRASKQGGIMQTDSSVYAMNKALRQVAQRTDCAYFDLFGAMGGTNAMVDWVERDRPLANKDYTHFNFRGSKKVADLITTYLLEEYAEYVKDEEVPDHMPGMDTSAPGQL